MAWPTPQDYNEAVQNPHLNFRDSELRSGNLEVTPMGLPRVASGAFASVYRMHTPRRDVAVRCFLHNVSDQQSRYAAISEFVSTDQLECTVDFEYLSEGVRIGGRWYPLLKMEWASGRPLDEWVRANLHDGAALRALCERFKDMLAQMRADGIAHGDLQHGNLLIQDDLSIRLVDYDGMFVPALEGLECPELGHRNYQHPGRGKEHFGPYLDNFAAWSIYVSLFSLSRDPKLMQAVIGGDESLLFRQYDYKNPTRSRTFDVLEQHADSEIVDLARKLRGMLALPPQAVPYLNDEVAVPIDLPEMDSERKKRGRAAAVASNLPEWMHDDAAASVDADAEDELPVDDEVDFRESLELASRKVVAATHEGPWPTLSMYMRAIMVPAASFLDEELRMCRPVKVENQLLVERSQQNAVFRLQRGARTIAVKLFLSPDDDRSQRYIDFLRFMQSSRAIGSDLLKYIPRIEYVEEGIRVHARTYPLVKMEWIYGHTLDQLEADAAKLGLLDSARRQFRQLIQSMDQAGFVHGELEPSNVIVSPEGLKLIDFDGVRVPGGQAPPAVSQSYLRHPREPHKVDVYSDCFPAWAIDTALTVLREEPDLRFVKPAGQFILEHDDFLFPENSDVLQTLRDSKKSILYQRYELLNCFLKMDPYRLPPLKVDAGIDKAFARNHSLNFPDVSPGRVSPDVSNLPPSVIPPSTSLQLSTESKPLVSSHEALHKGVGFVFLVITVQIITHSGIIAAVPFFIVFLFWMKVFGPKKD